jgi:two-component system phosphate regulon sensor histidine kinase PhoR
MAWTDATSEDIALHEALEALPDPVILTDRRATVVFSNAAARETWPSLGVGRPLFFTLRMPDVVDAVEQVLTGASALTTEFVERLPVERAFRMRASVLPTGLTSSNKERAALLLAFHDLTAARRIEAMRVDFVANASHELRTPLASLMGFIETLQGPARNDPAARERFLAIMRTQAQRMSRLVDDLLSLSRVELNEHRVPREPVDMAGVARQIVDVLGSLSRERGVEINLLVQEEASMLILGDQDELLRVAENLIENAIKYGQSGGRVDVNIERRMLAGGSGEIIFSVLVYGIGISPENPHRLTARLYRAAVMDSRDKGGTGLGLAIVKHIVNRHRGRLSIESTPGEGAVFRVVLPAA